MRVAGLIFAFLTALSCGAARAEDAKPDVAKPGNLDVNLRGVLREKPKDAGEKVVAVFIVTPKKFDIIDEKKTVNLFASGEVAKTLLELVKESKEDGKLKVEISGTIAEGGINVTQAEAVSKKKPKKVVNAADPQPAKTDAGKSEPSKTKASDEEF